VHPHRTLVVLLVLACLAAAASLVIGTGDLSNARLARTFLELRGARFAAAFIAGATLAVGEPSSRASFAIPRIVEVDGALLGDPSLAMLDAAEAVFEQVHPDAASRR
jgi:hypothetical protein